MASDDVAPLDGERPVRVRGPQRRAELEPAGFEVLRRRLEPGAGRVEFGTTTKIEERGPPGEPPRRLLRHVMRRFALELHDRVGPHARDRKSTRLNSSHGYISYAAFCLK